MDSDALRLIRLYISHSYIPWFQKLTDAALEQVQLLKQSGNMPNHLLARSNAMWPPGPGPFSQTGGAIGHSHPQVPPPYPYHAGHYGQHPPPPAGQPTPVSASGEHSPGPPSHVSPYIYGHHQGPYPPPPSHHYQQYHPQYFMPPPRASLDEGLAKTEKDSDGEKNNQQISYGIHASSSDQDDDCEER
jgi:hypothetical protein